MIKTDDSVQYRIDRDNRLCWVNAQWQIFARENDGQHLLAEKVIGKPILDFFSGKVTRQYWEKIFADVRAKGEPLVLDFRCDSPEVRRAMRMQILPDDVGELLIISRLLSSQPLTRAVRIQRAEQRSRHTLVRCSQCNRVKHPLDWLDSDALFALDQKAAPPLSVIYGICPACLAYAETSSILTTLTEKC